MRTPRIAAGIRLSGIDRFVARRVRVGRAPRRNRALVRIRAPRAARRRRPDPELRRRGGTGSTARRSRRQNCAARSCWSTFGSIRASTAFARCRTCANGIAAITTMASSSSAFTRRSSIFLQNAPNVAAAAKRLGVTWPIVLDDNSAIWKRYGNNIWPHEYLYDQNGRLVESVLGEGGYPQTEARIQALLKGRRAAARACRPSWRCCRKTATTSPAPSAIRTPPSWSLDTQPDRKRIFVEQLRQDTDYAYDRLESARRRNLSSGLLASDERRPPSRARATATSRCVITPYSSSQSCAPKPAARFESTSRRTAHRWRESDAGKDLALRRARRLVRRRRRLARLRSGHERPLRDA